MFLEQGDELVLERQTRLVFLLILPGVPRLDESTVLLFAVERTEVGNLVPNAVCYQWRYGLRWEPFCESAHRDG